MTRTSTGILLLSCIGLLWSIPAFAQWGTTRNAVNMRAGPGAEFPLVSWLPRSTSVRIVGCTSGWRWCDIVSGRTRGWIHSRYLSGVVRGRTPVIGFSVQSYWDAHYRGRPWYSSQPSWIGWGSPSFQPPPPPPRTSP